MKDFLQDIVQHTYALGVIDTIKITGNEEQTLITSIAEDRSVIVEAKFKNPIPEFIGTFGMPNLGKLNTIINIPEYKDDAKLTITYETNDEDESLPSGIHFENKNKDFKNDYRFMSRNVINDLLKNVRMKQVKWNVECNPSVANITRMKYQAQANSDEQAFISKTENNSLKFYFGNHSSHAGSFVFADGITGTLSKNWHWPVNVVINILGLAGDKSFKISDEGVMQITVDSGIAVYDYKIPAMTK